MKKVLLALALLVGSMSASAHDTTFGFSFFIPQEFGVTYIRVNPAPVYVYPVPVYPRGFYYYEGYRHEIHRNGYEGRSDGMHRWNNKPYQNERFGPYRR